jgi:hypothetical protein
MPVALAWPSGKRLGRGSRQEVDLANGSHISGVSIASSKSCGVPELVQSI